MAKKKKDTISKMKIKRKTTNLEKISTQSNIDYLRYWVLIGQSKIDEAMGHD